MSSGLSNAEKFISVYNEIDHILRVMLHEENWVGYHELVVRASRFNRVVREYEEDLKQIGDLRNAIVHRSTNQIIAEPAEFIVELAEKIRQMLVEPPKVFPKFRKDVLLANIEDSIEKVAHLMADNNFSRIPVYEGYVFSFLATAEDIVRFIAGSNSDESLDRIPVSEVERFTEHKDNVQFVSPVENIFKVAEMFEIYHRNGKKIEAVLITKDGSGNSKPIGIITLFDIGEIYREMEIRVNNGIT